MSTRDAEYFETRSIAPTSSVKQVLTYQPSPNGSVFNPMSAPPINMDQAAAGPASWQQKFGNYMTKERIDTSGWGQPAPSGMQAGQAAGLSFPFNDGTYGYDTTGLGPTSLPNVQSEADNSWSDLYDGAWQNVLGEYTNSLAEQADELQGYERQLEDIDREMRQATEQHGLALEGIAQARTQLGERHDLSLAEIAQLRAELDEQEQVVNENYDLAIANAALKQKTLDAALEAVTYAKANGVSNEEAIQVVYGRLKEESSELWKQAAGTLVDTNGLSVVASEAESRVLDEYANSVEATAAVQGSELSEAAMQAIGEITGQGKAEVIDLMESIANAEVVELTGIGTMMNTNAELQGALSDLGFTGRQLISEGNFRNQQQGFDAQIQDLGFQQEGLNLEIEGINLGKDQALRSIDLGREEANLRERGVNMNYDHALEDLWLKEKSENLTYSHVLEDMLDMEVRTYEDLAKAADLMREDPEQYKSLFALGVQNEVLGLRLSEYGIDGYEADAIMAFVQGAIESGTVSNVADLQSLLPVAMDANPELADIFGSYHDGDIIDSEIFGILASGVQAYDQALDDADDMIARLEAADGMSYSSSGNTAGQSQGSSAPNNYANRYDPVYRQRAALAADVASKLPDLFPQITRIGGVNYYRPPTDVGNGRAANSDHQSAGAIDVYAPPEVMKQIEAWAETQPYVSYVVYSGDQHHEGHHVHLSFMLGYGSGADVAHHSTPTNSVTQPSYSGGSSSSSGSTTRPIE